MQGVVPGGTGNDRLGNEASIELTVSSEAKAIQLVDCLTSNIPSKLEFIGCILDPPC